MFCALILCMCDTNFVMDLALMFFKGPYHITSFVVNRVLYLSPIILIRVE